MGEFQNVTSLTFVAGAPAASFKSFRMIHCTRWWDDFLLTLNILLNSFSMNFELLLIIDFWPIGNRKNSCSASKGCKRQNKLAVLAF